MFSLGLGIFLTTCNFKYKSVKGTIGTHRDDDDDTDGDHDDLL